MPLIPTSSFDMGLFLMYNTIHIYVLNVWSVLWKLNVLRCLLYCNFASNSDIPLVQSLAKNWMGSASSVGRGSISADHSISRGEHARHYGLLHYDYHSQYGTLPSWWCTVKKNSRIPFVQKCGTPDKIIWYSDRLPETFKPTVSWQNLVLSHNRIDLPSSSV